MSLTLFFANLGKRVKNHLLLRKILFAWNLLCVKFFLKLCVQCVVWTVKCAVCIVRFSLCSVHTLCHSCLKVHGAVPILLCIFWYPLMLRINFPLPESRIINPQAINPDINVNKQTKQYITRAKLSAFYRAWLVKVKTGRRVI